MSERTYQIIIGVLVLIILIGGWSMIASRGADDSSMMGLESDASTTQNMTAGDSGAIGNLSNTMPTVSVDKSQSASSAQNVPASEENDSVSVMDQPAGSMVNIQSVTIGKVGWVAVRGSDGWIRGAERVQPGTTKNVAITLLKPTVAGQTYDVVLYVDDGDMKFDLHKDTLVTRADGTTLSAAFLAK